MHSATPRAMCNKRCNGTINYTHLKLATARYNYTSWLSIDNTGFWADSKIRPRQATIGGRNDNKNFIKSIV